MRFIQTKPFILAYLISSCISALCLCAKEDQWSIQDPLFVRGDDGSFCEIAVKDPSIVFHNNKWHLFFTARSRDEYTTGYAAAPTPEELNQAGRHQLSTVRGETPYGCAPQIFYFEPQDIWYLIFQTKDENYQPAFVMTKTIEDPHSWSEARPLLIKDSTEKWIDFWVICDDKHAYLFYTQSHCDVMVRRTKLTSFPSGWGESRKIFSDVHEAVHVYKAIGKDEYRMIYELNHGGVRLFGLATASDLFGPWIKISDRYADGTMLAYTGSKEIWAEMVSHGEAIRTGYDQRLEYDPMDRRWLIQSLKLEETHIPYPLLPWKLGLMQ